ncbi:hypothetical protein ACIBI9_34925 [Nonomuraea sp. NPDC050451]|uniref:hypothetical protein n=1 Tax=Nonomuraea sp. NPDC050451 TaxID=3364364 RepID=UPI0037B47D0E
MVPFIALIGGFAVLRLVGLAGAAGLLIPALAPFAAIGLALLMVAMFPANVSAARRGLTLAGKPVTPLVARTALQVLFIAAAVAAAV